MKSKKPKSPSLTISVILLVVAVVAGTYLYLRPTEPVLLSTEGWKTCRNEKAGYEIKYPADWYVLGNWDVDSRTYSTECTGWSVGISNKDWQGTERVLGGGKYQGIGIEALLPERFTEIGTDPISTLEEYFERVPILDSRGIIKESLLDGEHLVWIERTQEEENFRMHAVHNGTVYDIRTSMEPQLLATFLSTFKFID